MSERLTVRLSQISSLAELATLWQALDPNGKGSFFTSWAWLGTWLETLPPTVAPQVLRLERNGECRGAALVVPHVGRRHGLVLSRGLHLNETGNPDFDCVTIEHNGFAGLDPDDHAAWRAITDWFASGAAAADELHIPGVTSDIECGEHASRCLRSERTSAAYRVDLVRVRSAGGKIGASMSANARQQLNRSKRDLAALGPLVLDAAQTVDEALSFFEGLKHLHIRSWTRRSRPHAFTYPFWEQFHRRLIERFVAAGTVEMLRLSAGAKPLGYLYNFCRDGRVYAYQSGFADEDRRLRPGYVAHALAIERHCAAGAATYDFMAGSNRLKESFATDRYVMRWCTIQRPLLRFKAENAARAAKSRILQPLRARGEER
jgi:CelD/BcsL family acetyltransferase involved in cellulose biosynthesis